MSIRDPEDPPLGRLFKYQSVGVWTESTLSEGVIFSRCAEEQNDAFECYPRMTAASDPGPMLPRLCIVTQRQNPDWSHKQCAEWATMRLDLARKHSPMLIERLLRTFRTEVGIYSMSEDGLNELMWSHYGDSYRGYCMEFEATSNTPVFGEALRVRYSDADREVDIMGIDADEQCEIVFLTKRSAWSYEREWRILSPEALGVRTYRVHLLKSVTFGHRMDVVTRERLIAFVRSRGHPVGLYVTDLSTRGIARVRL